MLLKCYIKLIISLFIITGISYAQTAISNSTINFTVSVPEVDSTIIDSSGYKLINFYKSNDPSKPGEFTLPKKHIVVAIPPNSIPKVEYNVVKFSKVKNAVPATNSSVVRLNDSTITYKKTNFHDGIISYKQQPAVQIGNTFWLRDFYCVELIINSHQFDVNNNSIRINKLIDIKLNLDKNYNIISNSPIQLKSKFDENLKNIICNYDIAEQFRSFYPIENASASDDWINYNQDYIKLSVVKDGLYRLTKTYLTSLGINTSAIDPRTFRLYESGIEQRVYVEGEGDVSFDNNDYIEFYGIKNYTKTDHHEINGSDEQYNTYLNRYTDTTYYFLTWGPENGKRYAVDNSVIDIDTDVLEFHTTFRHYEQNAFYQSCNNDEVANQTSDWNKNKNWYWGFIFEGTKNFSVKLDNLYPFGFAEIYSKLTSYASNITVNSHQVTLRFNNEKIDSQNVNRFNQFLLSGSLLSQKLTENSNTLSIQNYGNNSVVNSVLYDWYEIEYPRYNVLADDSLIIKVPEGLTDEVVTIQYTNANSTSYSIYKIAPKHKKIVNYSIMNGNISFKDTISSGDMYVIFSENRIFIPSTKYLGRFANLRSNNTQADYLAITTEQFNDGVTSYINQINSLFNLSVKKIFVEDIFNEFGFGYPAPEAVKDFVINAYNNWSSPKVSYLALIGDATYDYKDYTLKNSGVKLSNNYVPSYGNPIGDNWYALWDDVFNIPQLKVGRIPVQNEAQLQYYLDKLTANSQSEFNDWNKQYLFFSGGKGNNPSELQQLKAANDEIISNVIEPRPISGNYYHFYKTSDPVTDFGPYTTEEINTAIDNGGLFISYVGHSGTSTWDNSINEASQLQNNINRNPVISDFGCSTNKFGEPDIICFGEKFLLYPEGQALNYIGNSSLGFTSTAIPAPKFFYESFCDDLLHEVGNAHIYAKTQLYNIFGSSAVYKVFALSNSILGDPAVRLKIPNKPNLLFEDTPLLFESSRVDDSADSVEIKMVVTNLGLAPLEECKIRVQHFYKEELIGIKNLVSFIPGFKDILSIWIETKDLSGEHRLELFLDVDDEIAELDESDNNYNYEFTLYSSALRDMLSYTEFNGKINHLDLLNPILGTETSDIHLQIADNVSFTDPQEHVFPTSELLTTSPNLTLLNKRYWIRYKLNNSQSQFSSIKSISGQQNYNYVVNDQYSFNKQSIEGAEFTNNNLVLSMDSLTISVLSAGWYAGATCVIAKNGINLLDNSFFAGMGIVVLDEVTMEVDTSKWFQLFDNRPNAEALAALINDIPTGKIVVMGVADDGQHRLITELKTAIKTLGSTKIDGLKYRGSWAIIGRKGALPSDPDIIEEIRSPYDGAITLERDYIVPNTTGYLTTTLLGPVSSWDSLYVNYSLSKGTSIDVTPIGIKTNEQIDTLDSFNLTSLLSPLNFINADTYPYAKLQFKLSRNPEAESPTISEIGVNHHNAAELAINYQVVSVQQDTILQGKSNRLKFWVYNVGESNADSFRINVELQKPDNTIRLLEKFENIQIDSMGRQFFDLKVSPKLEDGWGNMAFNITVDTDDKILELYEDNNFYSIPFYVKKDTTVTSVSETTLAVTYDDVEINDGDYVSPQPDIVMILHYPAWFPLTDTNAISFSVNGQPISYENLNLEYDTIEKKITYNYKPQLADGEYVLRIFGSDIYGKLEATPGYEKMFRISNQAKIIDAYNYPNPFANNTNFTFRLTRVPDELSIKIYTVAGRLIKEIKTTADKLKTDFNYIPWDGKDSDGDNIANGVYLYRILLRDKGETYRITQKLAIVR